MRFNNKKGKKSKIYYLINSNFIKLYYLKINYKKEQIILNIYTNIIY